jgi:hypothetical protein
MEVEFVSKQRARRSTMNIRRIGLDLAKNVFTVCGVDEHGQVVVRKTLRPDHIQLCAFDPRTLGAYSRHSSHLEAGRSLEQ